MTLNLRSFFPFLLPIVLSTLNTVLFQTYSIHLNVCVPSVSSSARTSLLYCAGAHKNIISSSDDRGIGVRWPDGDRTDICRSLSDYSSFIHTARSPCDHRGIIPRWPNGDRPIYGIIFPKKFWTVAHRSPPDVRTASRRSPADGVIAPDIGR